ncbi:MAG: N(4)-(beta-N-acetylglucosaminyl)-L-asparaginase [Nonlabens sp.]
MNRSDFIKLSAAGGVSLTLGSHLLSCATTKSKKTMNKIKPISICTWGFTKANAAAGRALKSGMDALDAAITGVQVEEENIKNTTVGKGGTPDREGHVTLDACVMDHNGDAGSVVYVEGYTKVAALAKIVMEKTPHVMLAGRGAEQLAEKNGFKKEQLLNENTEAKYREWLKTSDYKPAINIENHDTIGMLCMDQNGDIAGACTTSGLAYKMHGRVGDSPIIGSGLFIDNKVGGAAATGMGEKIMKSVGSFLIVELMRQGRSPQEACEEALMRIVEKGGYEDFQIAYIAMDKMGRTGSFCIHPGFAMMRYQNEKNERINSPSYIKD